MLLRRLYLLALTVSLPVWAALAHGIFERSLRSSPNPIPRLHIAASPSRAAAPLTECAENVSPERRRVKSASHSKSIASPGIRSPPSASAPRTAQRSTSIRAQPGILELGSFNPETMSGEDFFYAYDDLDLQADAADGCLDDEDDEDEDEEEDGCPVNWSTCDELADTCLAKSTRDAYRRYVNHFTEFCRREGFIRADEVPYELEEYHQDMDYWEMAWIMSACDVKDYKGVVRTTASRRWTTAEKMRSAVTRMYSLQGGRGREIWHNQARTGNPSLSVRLSNYMQGLKRRKIQVYGEKAVCSQAVTERHMRMMYQEHQRHLKMPQDDQTGTKTSRLMMYAAITLAFALFLRLDEVLTLQVHEIEFQDNPETGLFCILVYLSFRKNDQLGKHTIPFVIDAFPPELRHLCPVRAVAAWLRHSGLTRGFIFRPLTARKEIDVMSKGRLSHKQFIGYFRSMLSEIGVRNVFAFGGHSIRRGAVQFANMLGRSVRAIVEWAGWSMNFDSKVVHRYLFSWTDDEVMGRQSFWPAGRREMRKEEQL